MPVKIVASKWLRFVLLFVVCLVNVRAYAGGGLTPILGVAFKTWRSDPVPGFPPAITATPGDEQVSLIWDSAPEATSYDVLRATASGGPYTVINASNTTRSYVDTGRTDGTTYYYTLTSKNAAGSTPMGATVSVVPFAGPTYLHATPSSNQIALAWSTGVGDVAYRLKRATVSGGPYNIIASPSTPSSVDTNVIAGSTYFYVVVGTAYQKSLSLKNVVPPGGSPVYASAQSVVESANSNEVRARPGLFSPIDIVPNPPLGILPDALTLVDWMEPTVPSDTSDAPPGGPSATIGVSLPHGVVDIDEGPDLVLDNPKGQSVAFERRYRTALAAANLSSPGLSPGWTHNWDYRIVPLQQGAWGPLRLVYPNGASEVLTPVLSGGSPTGAFTAPSGAPYIATGTPGSSFTWSSIQLKENGLASQSFVMPLGDDVYRLSSQTFDNGSAIYLQYTNKKLTSLYNNGSGATYMGLTLTYGASGGLLSLATDTVSGKTRGFSYTSGALVAVSNIGNSAGEWAYGYTSVGGAAYLSSVATLDPHGNATAATVAYDTGTGRASSVTDAKGGLRSYDYSVPGSAKVAVAGSLGASDGYTAGWDASKRQTSVANAAGDVTIYAYDATDPSQVTYVTPPLGGSTSVLTDSHGSPIRVNYPYGNYDLYTWEYPTNAPLGRVSLMEEHGTDGSLKGSTTFSYYGSFESGGKSGYLKSQIRPNGGQWTYVYTSLGSLASVSAPGSTLSYDYIPRDSGGNPIGPERYGKPVSIDDGNQAPVKLQYDVAGRVTGLQDRLGNVTGATYNQYDQLTGVQMPLQHALQIGYTMAGKVPVSTSIAVGGSSLTVGQASYDKESGLAATTDANNLTTSVTRDGHFDPLNVTNGANKAMHGFVPDPVHRAGQTTMGTGSRSLALNATMNTNGDLASVVGSDGRTTSVIRDQNDPGMVTSVRWQDSAGNQKRVDYTYDVHGRAVQAGMDFQFDPISQSQQPTYRRVFTYDAEDQVLTTSVVGRTVPLTTNVYNLDGTRDKMYVGLNSTLSNGAIYVVYAYGYDASRRLTSVTVNYANSAKAIVGATITSATYAYDANGRVIAVRTPKATSVYAYDALGQLTGLQNLTPDGYVDPNAPSAAQVTDPFNGTAHSILSAFSNFVYDMRGNRTGMHYDAMSYVFGSSSYGSGNAAWCYDAAGRLTSETWSGAVSFSSTYGYDGGDNLTSLRGGGLAVDAASDQLTGSAYSFNASGDMTRFAGGTIGYDQRGYLTSASGVSTYNTSETYSYAPIYDESGRRRAQTLFTSRLGLNNNWTESFVYDGDLLVYRVNTPNTGNAAYKTSDLSTTDRSVLYLWGPTGPVVEFDLSGDSKALTFDPQGNCVSTTNGQIVQPAFFDAYGKPINAYAGDDRYRQQPFQYKGQAGYVADAYSGLYYCLHRYYDHATGRWTQRDPIGLDGGVNVYGYVGGNPIMLSDPSGLQQGPDLASMFNWYFGRPDANAFIVQGGKGALRNAATGVGDVAIVGGRVVYGLTTVTSLIDPTPISDLINGGLSLGFGDREGAALSFAGAALPFVGGVEMKGGFHAAEFGIGKYSTLRHLAAGRGLQVHHLIEKRFASALGLKSSQMLSIILTKEEHLKFTNAWRRFIPYGTTASPERVREVAREIYRGHPEILRALGL